jgi:hypothetical protein
VALCTGPVSRLCPCDTGVPSFVCEDSANDTGTWPGHNAVTTINWRARSWKIKMYYSVVQGMDNFKVPLCNIYFNIMVLFTNRPTYSLMLYYVWFQSCTLRVSLLVSLTLPALLVPERYLMWTLSLRVSISDTTPTFKGQCLLWLRLTYFLPVFLMFWTWQYWSNCHRRSGGVRPRILSSLFNLPNRLLPVISRSKPSGKATLQPSQLLQQQGRSPSNC